MTLKLPKRSKLISTSHFRSKTQERELAKRIGGVTTPASGAKDIKGDARKKRVVRIEAKTTKNNSFSVTREMVQKIEAAALAATEMPVLFIEFNTNGKKDFAVCVVPEYVLDMICEAKENE